MKKRAFTAIVLAALAGALAAPATPVCALQRVAKKTLRASAVFSAGAARPVLKHTPLERVSAVTKIGIIKGEISGARRIDAIRIEYRKQSELSWSTFTVHGTGAAAGGNDGPQEFSFRLPPDLLTGNGAYRLTVFDGVRETVFPGDASWQEVVVTSQEASRVGAGGGAIRLLNGDPDAGQISLLIPGGALAGESDVTITELAPDDPSVPPHATRPAAVLRCEPGGLVFTKPVTLSMVYQDLDRDGMTDGTGYREDALQAAWWDGFEWRPLYSVRDRDRKTVSCATRHFSFYALFPAGAPQDDGLRCREKIITPGSVDAFNDLARFDMLAPGDTVELFDVNGRQVRVLTGGVPAWDGKDGSGNPVAGGVYVYQIHHAGRIISGRIVVAR